MGRTSRKRVSGARIRGPRMLTEPTGGVRSDRPVERSRSDERVTRRRVDSVEALMGPIAIRALLHASRRRLAIVVVLLGLAGAVAVHHGMPMDMHAMGGHTVCLALVLAGVALAAAVAIAVKPARARRLADQRAPVTRLSRSCRSVPARAGPLYLRLAVLRL